MFLTGRNVSRFTAIAFMFLLAGALTMSAQAKPPSVGDEVPDFTLKTGDDEEVSLAQLRKAGAIVLAKSNMAEFAFSPYQTLGSMLPGHTRNPYALERVPAGSSGGTAAAVAASFGTVGLGTDTGNSIRGPSSHTMLVGIRSTMRLTSRDGIIPLFFDRDIGGPMASFASG